MENMKISQMEEASIINDNDYIPIVQNGTNKKARVDLIGITRGGNGSIVIGNIGIEWGQKSVTSGETGTSVGGLTVYSGETNLSFANNYSSTPQIITGWRSAYVNQLSTASPGATTTGCVIRGYMLSANVSRTIGYLVIGNVS